MKFHLEKIAMKKDVKFEINKYLIYWLVWFALVILWNYGYPQASPFEDVFIAVALSVLLILLKKF